MKPQRAPWAVVLAGGDGTRLASLTRDVDGAAVPKQFCSLAGGRALLGDALARAACVAPRERTCVVVAEQHRRYWEPHLRMLDPANLVVEPRNCGTAVALLHAAIGIVKRDPGARLVVLPADHYIRDEVGFSTCLPRSLQLLQANPRMIVIVGVDPDGLDCDLGYLVPGSPHRDGGRRVARFAEKPEQGLARELVAAGAVWNTLIFAANGATLLHLLCGRLPRLARSMWIALAEAAKPFRAPEALRSIYAHAPTVDFSREILQGNEGLLRLLTIPSCGWNDLGTPGRLQRVLGDAQQPDAWQAQATDDSNCAGRLSPYPHGAGSALLNGLAGGQEPSVAASGTVSFVSCMGDVSAGGQPLPFDVPGVLSLAERCQRLRQETFSLLIT